MMDLPNWTVHVITFALGVATWLPATLWEGHRVTRRPQEPVMDPTEQHPRRRTSRLAVIILVSSLLIVGFGVQQGIYQHQANNQDQCIARYNADVAEVRDNRITATQDLADAQQAKDDAGDNVLLVTLDLIQKPPPADPDAARGELTRALIQFARKKAHLATVQQSTDATLEQNPYPTLGC